MSLQSELEELALSLESAVSLATTRIEHVRVAGHATRARRLANLAAAAELDARQETREAVTAPPAELAG